MNPNQLKKLVLKRHPEYDAQKDHWEFLEATYYGGRGWFENNIFKYYKEGEGEFKSRIERAYRFNHTREVVDLVNKYLFRAKPVRKESAHECVKKFWEQSTISGLGINELMRTASVKSSIFGRPWMIVDSSVQIEEGESRTQADDQEGNGRVYAYIVSPINVLDMSYDDDGRLNWILIREEYRQDDDPFQDDGFVDFRYRLWTRTHWFLITHTNRKRNALKYEQREHGLGRVPAIPVDNQICDDQYESPALIADIAYLDRACCNYSSNLDAIIQDQTFSQLALPAQGILPGEGEDSEHHKMLEVGTKRIFTYDSEAGTPMFLSPDPRQAQLIIEAIQQIINEIYHCVGLAGERTKSDNAKGIDNSSGIAKGKDFERVNALLASKADSLELVENELVDLVCLWSGEEPPEENLVSYSEDFDVRELNDEFYIAMQLSLVDAPDLVRKAQMIKVVEKLFPHIDDERKQELLDEIDKWEFSRDRESANVQSNVKSKVTEEATRDRTQSGKIQSDTKERTAASENNALTQ